ncbi:hypothetical protein [Antarctobacter heliothermus]|uniref:Uncharacterized protein n=1 Tax=Antarctobacter heliothermus TaxID=74033 RepID=A0A239ETL5_9RHOB|nr:hypothetical protein [Antarctobacter heliothermus]SNS48006.1 hypothetical protein SAMN04488078_101679 [Antarctobacter heliothermus]
MFSPFRSSLSTLAFSLALAGTAQAYTILLEDDYNGGEYGSIWGKCQDGEEFEVRWLTEDGNFSYSIDTSVGDDQYTLIRDFCEDHGG